MKIDTGSELLDAWTVRLDFCMTCRLCRMCIESSHTVWLVGSFRKFLKHLDLNVFRSHRFNNWLILRRGNRIALEAGSFYCGTFWWCFGTEQPISSQFVAFICVQYNLCFNFSKVTSTRWLAYYSNIPIACLNATSIHLRDPILLLFLLYVLESETIESGKKFSHATAASKTVFLLPKR